VIPRTGGARVHEDHTLLGVESSRGGPATTYTTRGYTVNYRPHPTYAGFVSNFPVAWPSWLDVGIGGTIARSFREAA
jgi:hypothetical protein